MTKIELDFPRKTIRTACEAYEGRLKAVVKKMGRKFE